MFCGASRTTFASIAAGMTRSLDAAQRAAADRAGHAGRGAARLDQRPRSAHLARL